MIKNFLNGLFKPKQEILKLPIQPRYVTKRQLHGVPHLIKKHSYIATLLFIHLSSIIHYMI